MEQHAVSISRGCVRNPGPIAIRLEHRRRRSSQPAAQLEIYRFLSVDDICLTVVSDGTCRLQAPDAEVLFDKDLAGTLTAAQQRSDDLKSSGFSARWRVWAEINQTLRDLRTTILMG